ncbi:MAG: cadmium-translocating P-type ATPase [Clostridiales Family XIII bacterium]|nr:cadmium-translocating P-type ATPase [Clostridiales Family XIII bacterium]
MGNYCEHGAEHEHEHCCGHEHEHDHDLGHDGCSGHDFDIGCSCGHDHGHDHDHGEGSALGRALLIAGAALFAVGMALQIAGVPAFSGTPRFAVFLAAYILVGGEVLLGAGRNISKGQVFDENFLMAVASIGAFAIGEYPEGVAVMLFYRIGEAFEERAVDRSKRAITALMEVRPDRANLLAEDGSVTEADPEEVPVGARILVRPGERVPLDGVVVEGGSSLDTSALTGESVPVDVAEGSEVLAGAVNLTGLVTVEVVRPFGESAVAKILKLVQEAGANKAPAENFITKFARVYTPIVVIAAVCLAFLPPLFLSLSSGQIDSYGAYFPNWVNRALVFLVVSCPCALVISIPLSYFGGIGGASKNGILVKGGNYLEVLARTETVVFDKTGTLTKGKVRVASAYAADGFSEAELLRLAATAEQASTHPIAAAILAEAAPGPADSITEIAGKGVCAAAGGEEILAGSAKLLAENGVAFEEKDAAGTVVYLAKGGRYAGCIVLEDEVKPDAEQAVAALRGVGVKRTCMLTGDAERVAAAVAGSLGIDEYHAGLLPDEKVEAFAGIAAGGTAAFVGDGINDAPVLARADVGVAMGGLGSDAAIEAADVVLMTDEPGKLATAIRIAKKTHAIVMQNIIFALGVKGVLLVLGALGIAGMWAAVFGDVGVALIAILNALRALR